MKKIGSAIFISALLSGAIGVVQAEDTPPRPDNTAVNIRDRAPDAMTAGDQSAKKDDVDLTTRIRKAVVADDSLSMLAKNVKIVTANGMVTLRGPVNTDQEKSAIDDKAKAIAGADKIDDQLEVKK